MPLIEVVNPVLLNRRHYLTSPYGLRVHPVTGVKRMHSGVDLVGYENGHTATDYVIAWAEGMVSRNGYTPTLGYYVRIDHPHLGVSTQYQHLRNRCPFTIGDHIGKWLVIGYMGNTGTSTGAHLHFGVLKGGVWVDPMPYLEEEEEEVSYEQFKAYMEQYEAEKRDESADDYALAALDWAVQNGLIEGDGNGNLMPQSNIKREDMIVILKRYNARF